MPYYRYRASDARGRISKGRMEALHDTDLEARLKTLGLVLMRATPHGTRQPAGKRLPARALIDFLFQLEMQLHGGIPIRTALDDMRDAGDAAEAAAVSRLVASLLTRIETGATLAEAMQAHPDVFSTVTCSLIRAGELSGQLPEVLGEIVRSLKWQDEMLSKTRKLLIYPLFVLTIVVAVAFFLMTYLVPQLLGFLRSMGGEIPLHTRALLALSRLLADYWWAVLALPVGMALGLAALIRRQPALRYRLHQAALAMPYVGDIVGKSILARLADTFALMYRSGIPVLEGLACCEQVSANLVFQQAIARVRARIANGEAISASFAAEPLFPAMFIRMLKVGETTGALDTALGNINYFYSRDIEASITKAQALIEPAMSLIMGLILGWIMLSVLGPIYDTIASIKV